MRAALVFVTNSERGKRPLPLPPFPLYPSTGLPGLCLPRSQFECQSGQAKGYKSGGTWLRDGRWCVHVCANRYIPAVVVIVIYVPGNRPRIARRDWRA